MLILHAIDRWAFLTVCPVLLVFQVLFLVTYKQNPQLLVKPGNIFCGIVVIELALNVHLLANAGIYQNIKSTGRCSVGQ